MVSEAVIIWPDVATPAQEINIDNRYRGLKRLAEAGLSRIHVGLESGDDVILKQIKKGTDSREQIEAGKWVIQAGIELSLYVIMGIGGRERTASHAKETARVLNAINPHFIGTQ